VVAASQWVEAVFAGMGEGCEQSGGRLSAVVGGGVSENAALCFELARHHFPKTQSDVLLQQVIAEQMVTQSKP
jgi:hypothetical protein